MRLYPGACLEVASISGLRNNGSVEPGKRALTPYEKYIRIATFHPFLIQPPYSPRLASYTLKFLHPLPFAESFPLHSRSTIAPSVSSFSVIQLLSLLTPSLAQSKPGAQAASASFIMALFSESLSLGCDFKTMERCDTSMSNGLGTDTKAFTVIANVNTAVTALVQSTRTTSASKSLRHG